MKVIDDGKTIGPISTHIRDLTDAWLKNKDLVTTSGNEVYDRGEDNSASLSPTPTDNAEGNSVGTIDNISKPGDAGKGVGTDQTQTSQFKNWFGKSKTVDADGKPLLMYRGAAFDPLKQPNGEGVIKPEAYFTTDPNYAKRYAGSEGKVRAYYLKIEQLS